MKTTADLIHDLVYGISAATDAAQDAEDRENMGRASKIRAQVREMEAHLKALRSAPQVGS